MAGRVVAVTGVGRSGTSLAMQALRAGGATLSLDLVPPSETNVQGGIEDQEVQAIQRELLRVLMPKGLNLRPDAWQDTEAYRKARLQLSAVVARNMERTGEGVWAVKAPQMTLLIPLWIEVLEEAGVESRFVFCVRDVEAVIRSLMVSYGHQTFTSAQATYLLRTFYALKDLGSRPLVLAFEAWFSDPQTTWRGLLEFCGLVPELHAAPTFLKPELDHNRDGTLPECLTIVRELAAALCVPRIDPHRLRPVMREIERDLARPRGALLAALAKEKPTDSGELAFWESEARRRAGMVGELHFRLAAERAATAAVRAASAEITGDLSGRADQADALRKQLTRQGEQIAALEKQAKTETARAGELRRQLDARTERVASLKAQTAALGGQVATLQEQSEKANKRAEDLETQLREQREGMGSMKRSISWRSTAWLRFLGRQLS